MVESKLTIPQMNWQRRSDGGRVVDMHAAAPMLVFFRRQLGSLRPKIPIDFLLVIR